MNTSKFVEAATVAGNKSSFTNNGALTNESSLDACVDLFGSLAAMRSRSDTEVIEIFSKAFAEDKLSALKILFWCRDVRGGAGERKVPRTIFKYLAKAHTKYMRKNIGLLAEYGRWDDYLAFEGTPLWDDAMSVVLEQFHTDIDAEHPSLVAKWMPSINTSSKKTRALAKKFVEKLGWTEKQYRKTLSALREKISIVETAMCSGDWSGINYESVPSRAAMIYRKAFDKHDEERYRDYIEAVSEGKVEIKASTLYPYDIVRNFLGNGLARYHNGKYNVGSISLGAQEVRTLDAQWNALPNYVDPFNGLVMLDCSGSMMGAGANTVRPIDVAVGLTLYTAERNEGVWKDHFISFSSTPKFEKIKGSNIQERVHNVSKTNWDMSTNLISAFDLILDIAKDNKLAQSDMPQSLFIVSDMEFNQACRSNQRTNLEQIQKKYRKAGYDMPQLVFWNVNARSGNSPITVNDEGTALVSGASPSILKSVLSGEILTPTDVMRQTIDSERYAAITV